MTSATNGAAPRRWVGVGHGAGADSARGREAAGCALEDRNAALVIVFSSTAQDLAIVGAAVREVAGADAQLVGCTTAGEIAGLHAGGDGVVVIALGGPGLTVRTAVGSMADGPRAAGAGAAAGVADAESVLAGTHVACDEALAMIGDQPPVGLIAFDCAARRVTLGDDGVREEAALIAGRAPGVPVGGFYTYGEIARIRGSRGLHNATVVLLAIA